MKNTIETILNDLFTDSVKRYSTVTSSKGPIETISFTADNFDKFWHDVSQALEKVREETIEEVGAICEKYGWEKGLDADFHAANISHLVMTELKAKIPSEDCECFCHQAGKVFSLDTLNRPTECEHCKECNERKTA